MTTKNTICFVFFFLLKYSHFHSSAATQSLRELRMNYAEALPIFKASVPLPCYTLNSAMTFAHFLAQHNFNPFNSLGLRDSRTLCTVHRLNKHH